MNNIFLALDLELNTPDTNPTIIEIGLCMANIQTKEILNKTSLLINPNAILEERIIKLTGITQEMVNNGTDLQAAYKVILALKEQYQPFISPIVWGQGDARLLKEQLGLARSDKWSFGFRELDVKCLYQGYCIANGFKPQAGLKKSCNKMGVRFYGPAHRAHNDAEGTMNLFIKMVELYKQDVIK
jgi:DNA polymerase III alpha subunit (gram-positive type)